MQLLTRSEKNLTGSYRDDVEGGRLRRSSRGCLRIQQLCWIWKSIEDVWPGFHALYINDLLN